MVAVSGGESEVVEHRRDEEQLGVRPQPIDLAEDHSPGVGPEAVLHQRRARHLAGTLLGLAREPGVGQGQTVEIERKGPWVPEAEPLADLSGHRP
jgi:hypothetical protein